MAHTKAGGSTRLGRDSNSQRLGVKLFGGQLAKSGNIIVRQRGTKMVSGPGTAVGRDHTIYAAISGVVTFKTAKIKHFTSRPTKHTVVIIDSKI